MPTDPCDDWDASVIENTQTQTFPSPSPKTFPSPSPKTFPSPTKTGTTPAECNLLRECTRNGCCTVGLCDRKVSHAQVSPRPTSQALCQHEALMPLTEAFPRPIEHHMQLNIMTAKKPHHAGIQHHMFDSPTETFSSRACSYTKQQKEVAAFT